MGVRRLDRQRRQGLHSRQRCRGRPPTRRRARERRRDHGRRGRRADAEDDLEGDLCGHGTACAGVVRSIAPDAELHSVRVLGAGFTGSGRVLLAGLRWAVDQGFDVINMSLSTTKRAVRRGPPRDRRLRLLQAHDARRLGAQHARRVVPVAVLVRRLGGQPRGGRPAALLREPRTRPSSSSRAVSTSRSPGSAAARFARPATASRRRASPAIVALILGKHPRLTPFQLKTVLYLTAANVGGARMTDDGRLDAAVAAGVLASEQDFGRLAAIDRRGRPRDLRRPGVVDLPVRRGNGRARLRGGRGRRRAVARRQAHAVVDRGSPAGCSSSRTPLVLEDVQNDPRFARAFAEQTGYVPKGLMAVPLLDDERVARRAAGARPAPAVAVLPAGDGAARAVRGQAAIALTLLGSARTARAALAGDQAKPSRSPGSPRRSSGSRASGAAPGSRCCARSNAARRAPHSRTQLRAPSRGPQPYRFSWACYVSLPRLQCASTSSSGVVGGVRASAVA